jgi:hypothetical protein
MNDTLLNIASQMHSELCGCDDKNCTLTDEIFDWLYNGDAALLTESDIPDLLKEWREYTGDTSERGAARVDYGFILFLFFILAILCFVAYDFLPIAARVPSMDIPAANFDLVNSLFHLW